MNHLDRQKFLFLQLPGYIYISLVITPSIVLGVNMSCDYADSLFLIDST